MTFAPASITCLSQVHSTDGSIKFLWALADGKTVESIYFVFQEQAYTCISSQVGCNVHCPFCETGKQRNLRNLTVEEIYAQVALIRTSVRAIGGPDILYQVAFAGMGEPLLNYNHVVAAATQLRADGLTQIVSVSTSGIVPRIYDLAQTAATGVNKLFLSLHASNDAVRNRLVPVNKKFPLHTLLEAAQHFSRVTGVKVTATYVLFDGINDTEADLECLMALLDPAIYIVQLSEWNMIAEVAFTPSPHLDLFFHRLQMAGYDVFVQRSKGRDIEGGCGQLRSRTLTGLSSYENDQGITDQLS